MADQYHRQLLLTNEIYAREQSLHFASLCGDTLGMISSLKLKTSAYILQNKIDSAEIILKKVLKLYHENGYIQEEIKSSTMLMFIYTEQPERLKELKKLIDRYDSECQLFDEHGQLPPSKRQFFFYKGKYFEGMNQLDSAEYYYRRIQRPNMPFASLNTMYKGLLSLFRKRGIADSIAKYSELYCMVNDSSIAINDQERTAQLAASYHYNTIQKKARENDARAFRFQIGLIFSIISIIIFSIATVIWWKRFLERQRLRNKILEEKHRQEQKRQQRLLLQREEELRKLHKMEQEELHDTYQKKQEALRLVYLDEQKKLQTAHQQELNELKMRQAEKQHELDARQQVITIIQKELSDARKESSLYKTKLNQTQKSIERMSIQDAEHAEKVRLLETQLEELRQKNFAKEHLEQSLGFAETRIIKHIVKLMDMPLGEMTMEEQKELVQTTSQYYPNFISDINTVPNISYAKTCVCILTALNIRPGEIRCLLDLSPSIISNYKSELNRALFNETTAGNLQTNLFKRYHIYPCFSPPKGNK